MKLPPKKRPGNPILASDWNTLVDALAARTPRPSAGMEIVLTSGGFIYRVRPGASGSTPPSPPCPFGELITWTEEESTRTGIRGGVVYVGDKNFNFDATALNLETDGTWLVYFEIECERLLLPRSTDRGRGNRCLQPAFFGIPVGPRWSKTALLWTRLPLNPYGESPPRNTADSATWSRWSRSLSPGSSTRWPEPASRGARGAPGGGRNGIGDFRSKGA